jgi:hypothetical protein
MEVRLGLGLPARRSPNCSPMHYIARANHRVDRRRYHLPSAGSHRRLAALPHEALALIHLKGDL